MSALKKLATAVIVYEARFAVRRWRTKKGPDFRIVAVSGSVGKSSAKEAIAMALQTKFMVQKSTKSYNTILGLSLAILGLQTAWGNFFGWINNTIKGFFKIWTNIIPHVLVLELGIDRPNDMDALLDVARPDIAVISALGDIPVHVEFFSGPEEVAKEKSKLVRALSVNAYAVLNADDAMVWAMREKTNATVVSFGFTSLADFCASRYQISQEGISFKVDYKGISFPVRLFNVFGKQYVYSALSALAVANIFNINLIDASKCLTRYRALPGRLQVIDGIKKSIILDDTYNASPLATKAALEVLEELSAKRKIFVFGDMLELGAYAIEAHRDIGRKATFADYLILVGPRAAFAGETFLAAGSEQNRVLMFSTANEAKIKLKQLIKEGDLVLVKGSQSMRMERIVEEIMEHPDQAQTLLCRQEEYWKNKK